MSLQKEEYDTKDIKIKSPIKKKHTEFKRSLIEDKKEIDDAKDIKTNIKTNILQDVRNI